VNWTTASDLKQQLSRLWERGELLRAQIQETPAFPLRLPLKGPGSAEVTGQFEAVRRWIALLVAMPHLRIEWREVRHAVMGTQRLPQSLWIDSPEAAIAWLGRRREYECFAGLVALTRSRQPSLLGWLAKRPLQAVELAGKWPQLLDLVAWMQKHPRPGCLLRQVDVPGVHSKFIETHRAVLAELFDLVLPAEAIAGEHGGVGGFAARYGFLDKPVRIRFRLLDDRLRLLPGTAHPDVTLDAGSFAALAIPVRRVFITENETNFLAFPALPDSLVIFGAGYGWDALARARWLAGCTLHYWGDIDTHGFAILDQLRGRFAQVESFLMDRQTLMAHRALWGEEEKPALHDLPRLDASERALFDELRDNRIRRALRLEQERIGFHWVQAALARIADGER